jgi:hypothetical protein
LWIPQMAPSRWTALIRPAGTGGWNTALGHGKGLLVALIPWGARQPMALLGQNRGMVYRSWPTPFWFLPGSGCAGGCQIHIQSQKLRSCSTNPLPYQFRVVHSWSRRKCQTTPILSPLQKTTSSPIISLPGLLQLAEWMQSRNPVVQGGDPCHEEPNSPRPPAPSRQRTRKAQPALESADERTAAANADDAQRHRTSTTRRTSRRTGGAR